MSILKEISFQDSTIETIDFAIYDFLKSLKLSINTNEGFKEIDIVWSSAERSFQVKEKKERSDKHGTVNYPLIILQRENIDKDLSKKGTAWANIPHQRDFKGGAAEIIVARRIKQDKTSNFVNAETKIKKGQINFPRKSKKIVYETISISMPVYINVSYSILLKTQYQQQMNELLQPFITKTGGINWKLIKRDGHRFELFIDQNFQNNSNSENLGIEERKFETKINLKVLGYLIGLGVNQEQPKLVVRENAVDIKIPREHIIFGDISNHYGKQGYGKQGYIGIQSVGSQMSGSVV